MATTVNSKSALKLETQKNPSEVVLRCSGRLVADTCDQFQKTVRELMPTTKVLVVDMSDVTYLDSSALGAIVGLSVSAKHSGCRLKHVNLAPRVKELFSMTRLLEVLDTGDQGERFGM
jgi:anti-sigma B factor antagonist